jgi:hypothetical protein
MSCGGASKVVDGDEYLPVIRHNALTELAQALCQIT